jgi:integrase
MAWLEQKKSGQFLVAFRFGEQRFKRALRTKQPKEARAAKSRIEENIRLVERGRLTLPEDADVVAFLLSDGRVPARIVVKKPTTLSSLFAQYRAEIRRDSIEENSWATINLHLRHVERVLGKNLATYEVTLSRLQDYVDHRAAEPGKRQQLISPATIRKEIATFSSVWLWASRKGLLESHFPSLGLKYPKETDKPPFQNWDQIERRIKRGGLEEHQIKGLWESLYLNVAQINEAVEHAKDSARHRCIYPAIATAAFTGARRSELMRALIDDFDLDAETIHTREKKRVRGRLTTRVVPISKRLKPILDEWFTNHPGGQHAFCLEPGTQRIRNRITVPTPLTVGSAEHHFIQTFARSKWSRLGGWHVFRHSFASNCALKGLDQRMINEWMGHQTEAMVRRYRHLFPDQQQKAVNSVFAD